MRLIPDAPMSPMPRCPDAFGRKYASGHRGIGLLSTVRTRKKHGCWLACSLPVVPFPSPKDLPIQTILEPIPCNVRQIDPGAIGVFSDNNV